MKRNVYVFILLILLASSFKYRTKARETMNDVLPAEHSDPAQRKADEASFDAFVVNMHRANEAFSKGNPALIKSLWSRKSDVTLFTENGVKGWDAVNTVLDLSSKEVPAGSVYSYEKISSQVGTETAYLLQTEHYLLPNGKAIDLQVTLILCKEAGSWKIAHRQASTIKTVKPLMQPGLPGKQLKPDISFNF
jgi:hypothetical protein